MLKKKKTDSKEYTPHDLSMMLELRIVVALAGGRGGDGRGHGALTELRGIHICDSITVLLIHVCSL